MIFINCCNPKSLGYFNPFFPISIPFGVAYLSAILEIHNINHNIIDQQIHRNVIKEIHKIINQHKPPIIFCLSFHTEAASNAYELAEQIKQSFVNSIVIAGGIHSTAVPQEVIKNKSIDYVFTGEAENTIVEIYTKLKKNQSINSTDGIGYIDNNKIILNNPAKQVIDLDNIPIIPYEKFNNKKYNFSYIISSRGCPYSCIFCCNRILSNNKLRYNSVNRVINELDILINKYSQKEIAFFDDNFLSNKNRVIDICNAIRDNKLNKKASFGFQTRVSDIDPEILSIMAESGFKTVFFGIETISDKLKSIIGKKETIQQTTKAIDYCKKENIKVLANFIFALPSETNQDRQNALEYAKKMNIDVVKFNNVVPYPGTKLHDYLNTKTNSEIKNKYKNYNSQLTLVKPFYKSIRYPYLPVATNHYEISYDIFYAYIKFYLSFKKISNIILDRNWGSAIFSYGKNSKEIIAKAPLLIRLLLDLLFKFIIITVNKAFRRILNI